MFILLYLSSTSLLRSRNRPEGNTFSLSPLFSFAYFCLRQVFFFPCGSTAQFWTLAASMKLSVSFRLIDLGQLAGLLGRVISSSQGLCYLPRVSVMMETLVEWTLLAGDTEVLGENLPRRHFAHHKPHLPDPGRRNGKPATNRLSYGAALRQV
jgi:hypothetical protein